MRRHRSVRVLALLVALLALSVQPVASTHVLTDLLPDLVTMEPDRFVVSTSGGTKLLQFDNEVLNVGIGPLEVFTTKTKCSQSGREGRIARQRVFIDRNDDGIFTRGTDTSATTHPAGCMTFHAEHRHWHFDNFASYELYALGADGKRTGAPVRSAMKTTFCLIDIHRSPDNLPGSPTAKYYKSCAKNSTQGLSIGWSDEYTYNLAGQSFDITGLPPGDYCFVSVADPDGQLLELNEDNNEAFMRISIGTSSATLRPADAC